MLNITELKKGLYTGDYGDCVCDYDHGYIDDVITEIADSHTSIYYYDIKQFIINNFDAVENAIDEFGWDGVGGDLYKAGQIAEFLTIRNDLYENINDIIKLFAYNYIEHELKIDAISDDFNDFIDNMDFDSGDKLDDIIDAIDNFVGEQND